MTYPNDDAKHGSALDQGSPPHPARPIRVVILLLATLVVPATLTLFQVRQPGHLEVAFDRATPLGYTWSLSLFLVPIAVLGVWLSFGAHRSLQRRALGRTLLAVVPTGFALDFLLANRLFEFPNSAATLGLPVPVVGGDVPIEEFVFYAAGFFAVLLTYIWADESWLAAYNIPDYTVACRGLRRVVTFHGASVWIGAGLIGAGCLFKSWAEGGLRVPTYFTYLVLAAVIPSAGLFPAVRRFINWQAFSLVLVLVLFVSLLWEVTLGVPYGWWGYQQEGMLGLSVGAWSNLPIEAVGVWVAVTFLTVIVYEAMKVWIASGLSWREAALGKTSYG